MTSASKIGLPPGSLVYTGQSHPEGVRIESHVYSKSKIDRFDKIIGAQPRKKVWVDANGVHDTALIEKIGKHFGLHELTMEDIANPDQRPKLEEFENYIFIELNLIDYERKTETLFKEQVAVVFGKDFVITFQEFSQDVFKNIKEKLGRDSALRQSGPDYLAYTLIDSIVDHYFLILDEIREDAENIEVKLFSEEERSKDVMAEIYNLKKSILTLRKYLRPLEEAMFLFSKIDCRLIDKKTQLFSRDVIDHLKRIGDQNDHLSGLASEMIQLSQSQSGNHMNEIMKTLTLVGTIFIPLTFFTGLYGMNFEYMPELKWPYGYPVLLGSFAFMTAGMMVYFKRKKWF